MIRRAIGPASGRTDPRYHGQVQSYPASALSADLLVTTTQFLMKSRLPTSSTKTTQKTCKSGFSKIIAASKRVRKSSACSTRIGTECCQAAENGSARIAIYGHSWGASETVTLARELERDGIPVVLTIQVDSVPKPGQNDIWIPGNVSQAPGISGPRILR
jgi:hypothetical protein